MRLDPLTALVTVVALGSAAQWAAWRMRMPSIVMLLSIGFIAGPVTGLIQPDRLFGELLQPFVTLAVALILFEGGLSLNLTELRGYGRVVGALVTVGMLVSWVVISAAAHALAGLDLRLAALQGAVLVVTGPTVVIPLLRHVRPSGPVAAILKWEGIVIDPIGVLLAVLVFDVLASDAGRHEPWQIAATVAMTVFAGAALGVLAAGLLIATLRRYWAPDYLHNSVAMMFVAVVLAAADAVQPESGLFAVTVMGVVLANQRRADVEHIVEFKENLRVLLISTLFIILSARLKPDDLRQLGWGSAAFVAVAIAVARPLCVWVSTLGSTLGRHERLFLMWMAPRGVVAASVASIFSLRFEATGDEQARLLVPLTFLTIVATVLFYGMTAAPVARRLGLADANPQGVLLLGAHRLARMIAATLQARGVKVLLADTNAENTAAARMEGLPVVQGNVLNPRLQELLDLTGIGRMLAMTSNDAVNLLAARQFGRLFDRASVFALPSKRRADRQLAEGGAGGVRRLFDGSASFDRLNDLADGGAVLSLTPIAAGFKLDEFRRAHDPDGLPLFVIDGKRLEVISAGAAPKLPAGGVLVSLARTKDASPQQVPASSSPPTTAQSA